MGLKVFSRRRYLIKPDFQLRLALNIFIFVVFYSLVFGIFIFYPLYMEMQSSESFADQVRLSEITLYLHKRVWVGLIMVGVMAGVHAIFYSHRLVGPVYRFEKMIGELLVGNYTIRIKIRKRDELKEIERLLNRLADVLEHLRNTDLRLHEDIRRKLESVYEMLDTEGPKDPAEIRRLVKGAMGELGASGAP
jgi:methyl-accepting chemotaxis protein